MRICGEGGNFSLRKKVPSPAPLPPSKTAHTSTRKPSWPAGPEGFLVGRRMPPHAVCDAVSRDFFFRRVPLQDKPAPKNKTPAQGRRLTYGLCTTAQRGGPVHSSEKNVSGIGRGTGEGGRVSAKMHFSFPQPVRRQNSRSHFDGRSSSGLHASDDERRHNGFGCRSCSPQASGERITGTPPLLLRMPDPGLHHGANCPCAPAFLVSPV